MQCPKFMKTCFVGRFIKITRTNVYKMAKHWIPPRIFCQQYLYRGLKTHFLSIIEKSFLVHYFIIDTNFLERKWDFLNSCSLDLNRIRSSIKIDIASLKRSLKMIIRDHDRSSHEKNFLRKKVARIV